MKALLITILLLFLGCKTYASHTAGGYLEYKHIGGNIYEISFYFLRDCSGAQYQAPDLYLSNDCGHSCTNLGQMAILNTLPVDYGCGNTCGQSGDYPGFELIKSIKLVELPQPCDSWKLSVSVSARNGVDYAGNGDMYAYCKINNSLTNSNSPVIMGANILTGCINTTTNSVMSVIPPANTVPIFEMTTPLNSVDLACSSNPLTFEPGMSDQMPYPSSGNFSVNSVGSISFTPTAIGTSFFGLLVKNYDSNGNYLGEQLIQGMIYVANCPEPGNASFGTFSSSNDYRTTFSRGISGKDCESVYISSTSGGINDITVNSSPSILTTIESITSNLYKVTFCVDDAEFPPCEDKVYMVQVNAHTSGGSNCLAQGGGTVDSRTYTILRPKAYGCLQNVVVTNINTEDNSGAAVGTAYYRAQERVYVGDEFPSGLTNVPPGSVLFDHDVTFEAGTEVVLPSCVGGATDCVTLTAGSTIIVRKGICSQECLDPIEVCVDEYFDCYNEQIQILVEGGTPPYSAYVHIEGELAGSTLDRYNSPISVPIGSVVRNLEGNIEYQVTVVDASGTPYITNTLPLVGTKRFYRPLENNMLPNPLGDYKYAIYYHQVTASAPFVFYDDVNTTPPYYGATSYKMMVFNRWGEEMLYTEKDLSGSNIWSFDNGEFYWTGNVNNNLTGNCGVRETNYTMMLEAKNCYSAGIHVDCLEDIQVGEEGECGFVFLADCYQGTIPWTTLPNPNGNDFVYRLAGNFDNGDFYGYNCSLIDPGTGPGQIIQHETPENLASSSATLYKSSQNELYDTDFNYNRRGGKVNQHPVQSIHELNLSPNPFTDKVTIDGDIEFLQQITIYDAKMQLVRKIDSISEIIDLSDLEPGVYMTWATWIDGSASSYKLVKL